MEKKKCELSPVMARKKFHEGAADINSLPEEIMVKIFEYMTQKELGQLARVCRMWSKWTRYDILWKKVDLNIAYDKCRKDVILGFFKQLPDCVTHIKLCFAGWGAWPGRLNFQELCVSFHGKYLHLQMLRLYHVKFASSLLSVIVLCDQFFPNLKILSLAYSDFTYNSHRATESYYGESISRIEVLDVSGCDSMEVGILSRLPYLKKLHWANTKLWDILYPWLYSDTSFWSTLKVLNLQNSKIMCADFEAIMYKASNLTDLYVCNTHLAGEDLTLYEGVLPNLKTICINECDNMTVEDVVSFIESCPSLQCVRVSEDMKYAQHDFFLCYPCKLEIIQTTKQKKCSHHVDLE